MPDTFDAFTGGVTLGGLRTKHQIRILLCYLLKSIDTEISKSGLNDALQMTQLVNFFEANSALASLTESGLVEKTEHDGDEYYSLTAKGAAYGDILDVEVPSSVREKAVKAALAIVAREKRRRYTDVKVEKLDHGYHVTLTVSDNGVVMMSTVLYASDQLQAEALGESFLEHPEKLYAGIVDLLTL